MIGERGIYLMRQALNESTSSSFLDNRTSYDYLWEAAKEFNRRTRMMTSYIDIPTVANQSTYTLPPDFMRLIGRDWDDDPYIEFRDGSSKTYIKQRDYDRFVQGQDYTPSSSSVPTPTSFTLHDYQTDESPITGTASSTSSLSNGESTLSFTTSTLYNVGDYVANTTDGSSGIVIEVNSDYSLVTALFGGTNNYWTSGNAFVLIPQPRWEIILDPPPSTSSSTIRVYYTQIPSPVYSLYRQYRFASQWDDAIASFAAFKYDYRDRQENRGDKLYQYFDLQCRRAIHDTNMKKNETQMYVNFNRRTLIDRSIR